MKAFVVNVGSVILNTSW